MSSKKRKPIEFEGGSGNIFADLGLEDSGELYTRAQIGVHVFRILRDRKLKQRQIADILGNSPAIVRKHYGKWSKGRQDSIDRLMFAHFETGPATFPVTNVSHEKTGAVN